MKNRIMSLFLAAVLVTGTVLTGCGPTGMVLTGYGATGTGDTATGEEAASAEGYKSNAGNGVEGAVQVTDPASLTEEEVPMYFLSADNKRMIKLYFADADHEIPYLDADTVKQLLEDVYHEVDLDEGFGLTLETNGHTATLTRENKYTMEIDCDADAIRFMDYDAFLVPSNSPTVIDVLEHYGLIPMLQQVEESSYSRFGSAVSFDLAPYGIDLIEKDGTCYVPMQTFADICTSLSSYVLFLYNGEYVCVYEYGSDNPKHAALLDKYYEAGGDNADRSEALASFNYQELCMTLDYCYGLKEQHNIESFDAFFNETGLKKRMLSTDAIESTKAMRDLVSLYFSDGHSGFDGNSYRIGEDADTKTKSGKNLSDLYMFFGEFGKTRAEAYPDGVPGYEEIGNTAYISFDGFSTLPKDVDYYKTAPTAEATDTVGICLYAFSQITREDSPVENVVLDMSVNGGGDSTSASFVLSMFLGEASICVEDTLTGAFMNETFHCDANLDGKFDDKDSLDGYRLFCLTSPCSFSCGNLVPSVLQSSKKVKTVGMTSAGGACIVMPISTTDGTLLQLSGNRRLGYMKNGSIYDIDRGVEPDYHITTIDRFFDRNGLTQYINGLY